MPRFRTAQNTFQAGQLNPLLTSRTDLQAYKDGLATSTNWWHLAQGGVMKRQGFKFLADIGATARIIPWTYSSDEAYVLVLYASNVKVFSTTGTLISTKDNPSNNLCTNNWTNPTVDTTADSIKNIGNTALIQQSSFRSILGTLGVQAGKWYAEFKLRTATGTSNYAGMGIVNVSQQPEYALGSASSKKIGEYGNTVAYFSGGAVIRNTSTVRTDSTFTSGDIISIAMDCDNGFVYWAKNNTWQNSGDPTSGATGTGGYNFFTYLGTGGIYVMGVTGRSGASSAPYFDVNWGNGAYANANFGSPNADGNGFGAFSYAPPTGFLTMCTKNIETNG